MRKCALSCHTTNLMICILASIVRGKYKKPGCALLHCDALHHIFIIAVNNISLCSEALYG